MKLVIILNLATVLVFIEGKFITPLIGGARCQGMEDFLIARVILLIPLTMKKIN